jgi:hypothetical protein
MLAKLVARMTALEAENKLFQEQKGLFWLKKMVFKNLLSKRFILLKKFLLNNFYFLKGLFSWKKKFFKNLLFL